jgi:hypothetical protein
MEGFHISTYVFTPRLIDTQLQLLSEFHDAIAIAIAIVTQE